LIDFHGLSPGGNLPVSLALIGEKTENFYQCPDLGYLIVKSKFTSDFTSGHSGREDRFGKME
jgi:hypothetical protein